MKEVLVKIFPYLIFIFRLIVGGVFLFAAYTKILEGSSLISVVRAYHILPEIFVVPFARILPFAELLFGLWMFIGLFTRLSSIVISFLLSIFIIALSVNILRGNFVNCGCFGQYASADSITWNLVIRDIIFLVLTILVIIKNPKFLSVDKFLVKNK